ncbi:MAG: sigma-70 family RNA polymerase sigma factor [Phycisphaerales bacterium]|nr:MAG: sigma-70 family RNA polymerase sigma factor [Phycisphaerales bacterium]
MDNDSRAADDGRLIARARSDSEAFVQLYRMHYDAVFRYCAHRLFDRAAAEDVTSQVFVKVVEKFASFKGDERQFRGWLYRIATNAVNQYLRKSVRRNRLLERARGRTDCCGNDGGQSAARLRLLKDAMLALKPRYQTVIALRFFEDLKVTEIAEVLHSSPGTVRSQMARALAKLRDRCVAAGQET